jgi:hypothetical protein
MPPITTGRQRTLHLGARADIEGHRHEAERWPPAPSSAPAAVGSCSAPSRDRIGEQAIALLAQVADEAIITTPLSTATPDRAMKPTPAEIDSGRSAQQQRRTPPVNASGTPENTIARPCAEPNSHEQQAEDQHQRDRHHHASRLARPRSAARRCRRRSIQ